MAKQLEGFLSDDQKVYTTLGDALVADLRQMLVELLHAGQNVMSMSKVDPKTAEVDVANAMMRGICRILGTHGQQPPHWLQVWADDSAGKAQPAHELPKDLAWVGTALKLQQAKASTPASKDSVSGMFDQWFDAGVCEAKKVKPTTCPQVKCPHVKHIQTVAGKLIEVDQVSGTTPEFWSCACDSGPFWPKSKTGCTDCGENADECADAVIDELDHAVNNGLLNRQALEHWNSLPDAPVKDEQVMGAPPPADHAAWVEILGSDLSKVKDQHNACLGDICGVDEQEVA